MVRSIGLQARTFGSGREFLDTFDDDWRGCVILDVRMPGMSGLEVQKQLLERGATMPIIFVTAQIIDATGRPLRGADSLTQMPVSTGGMDDMGVLPDLNQ